MTRSDARKRWLSDREYEVGNEPTPDAHAADREAMAKVLAEHGWDMAGPTTCKCGWDAGDAEDWHRLLHEHVADALVAAGYGPVAEIQAERDREKAWHGDCRHAFELAKESLAEARARLADARRVYLEAVNAGLTVQPTRLRDALDGSLTRPEGGSDAE